jgi:hypothetical protein
MGTSMIRVDSTMIMPPPHASTFTIKSFDLFDPNAGYLWCFYFYKAEDTETESTIILPDTTKTATLMKYLAVTMKVK